MQSHSVIIHKTVSHL